MEYDLVFEKEISKFGFKKKWLSDHSGYWMFRHFKYNDLSLSFTIESDRKIFTLGVKTGCYQSGKIEMHKYYDDLVNYKCDIKIFREVMKKYKIKKEIKHVN